MEMNGDKDGFWLWWLLIGMGADGAFLLNPPPQVKTLMVLA